MCEEIIDEAFWYIKWDCETVEKLGICTAHNN
jgi:hypothetical protein